MNNIKAGEAPVVQFNAKALAPVAIFKSTEDVRYYLNGICCQPGPDGDGCFVIGCDGHRLAVWYDALGKCSRQIVLRVSREIISASKKKEAKDGRVVLDGNRLVLLDAFDREVFVQAGKAEIELWKNPDNPDHNEYPDVWRVIPEESKLEPGAFGSLNGSYIEDIGKAAKAIGTGGKMGHNQGASFFTGGGKGGIIVARFEAEKDFIVLTMPMRTKIEKWPKLPAYVSRKHAERQPVSAPATALHPMGSMGEAIQ